MATDRLVTGNALNEVLRTTKDYIDINDFNFVDAQPDEISDFPAVTFCKHENIDEARIDDLINKYFTTK